MKLKLGDKIYTYYIQDDVRARRLTIAEFIRQISPNTDNLFYDRPQFGESFGTVGSRSR